MGSYHAGKDPNQRRPEHRSDTEEEARWAQTPSTTCVAEAEGNYQPFSLSIRQDNLEPKIRSWGSRTGTLEDLSSNVSRRHVALDIGWLKVRFIDSIRGTYTVLSDAKMKKDGSRTTRSSTVGDAVLVPARHNRHVWWSASSTSPTSWVEGRS